MNIYVRKLNDTLDILKASISGDCKIGENVLRTLVLDTISIVKLVSTDIEEFSDEDIDIPEDLEIEKYHPLNGGSNEIYLRAVEIVSAKHSKYALVDVVNWLLNKINECGGKV